MSASRLPSAPDNPLVAHAPLSHLQGHTGPFSPSHSLTSHPLPAVSSTLRTLPSPTFREPLAVRGLPGRRRCSPSSQVAAPSLHCPLPRGSYPLVPGVGRSSPVDTVLPAANSPSPGSPEFTGTPNTRRRRGEAGVDSAMLRAFARVAMWKVMSSLAQPAEPLGAPPSPSATCCLPLSTWPVQVGRVPGMLPSLLGDHTSVGTRDSCQRQ